MTAGAPPALDVAGLSHRFGATEALREVSLRVEAGRFVALLGVNGAGKSTLFNLVTRLYSARVGRIAVCGADLAAAPGAALAQLGVVFQSRSLDGALTVAQNVIYHGALRGLSRRAALARGEAALARVDLSDQMGARVAALSGGQSRRVEIACALLHEPALLLCDEATIGLDVKARADIVAHVHDLAAGGVGVLWATHLVDEIRPEDEVAILHRGAVLAKGFAADVAGGATLEDAFLSLTAAAAT